MSSGNHAQALAYHAAQLGVPAVIVMPKPTPQVKDFPYAQHLAVDYQLDASAVKEAADELGYASAASFSRAFAQQAGQPPTAWRQVQA